MIYLDHNGTTPVAGQVFRAMGPYLAEQYGNPSTDYDLGRSAKSAYEKAREQVAALMEARPEEILFTSGGTESNNTVLKGLFYRKGNPFHLITTRIEHPAITNPALFLMSQGADVTFVRVDRSGRVDPDEVARALRPETALISVMLANNETGIVQPIREIAEIAGEHGVLVHTDAAQALGKIPVNVDDLGVDFLTLAGHKLYAPKGIGALFIRRGLELEPLHHGAAQESGRRAGTENVALAVGLGEACRLAKETMGQEALRQAHMRDRLLEGLKTELPDLLLVGQSPKRLPNTLNVCFPSLTGAEVLAGAPEIRASTGAACHAGSVKISPVLYAMGLEPEVAKGAVRLSLGRSNSPEQIEQAIRSIVRSVHGLAGHS